jgi:hypothetical protein
MSLSFAQAAEQARAARIAARSGTVPESIDAGPTVAFIDKKNAFIKHVQDLYAYNTQKKAERIEAGYRW